MGNGNAVSGTLAHKKTKTWQNQEALSNFYHCSNNAMSPSADFYLP